MTQSPRSDARSPLLVLWLARVTFPDSSNQNVPEIRIALRQSQTPIRPRVRHNTPRQFEALDGPGRFVRIGVDHHHIV
jgi:hypothetical protein